MGSRKQKIQPTEVRDKENLDTRVRAHSKTRANTTIVCIREWEQKATGLCVGKLGFMFGHFENV